ncbi:MAG TPA: phosphotransferase [Planktothrix sp.]
MSASKENDSLTLLTPAPEEMLESWLREFYGKPVRVTRRQLLRHRDLSYVERLHVADGLPESIIYKLVLPPWDIEQDLHERILIPSVSNSPTLFLSAHYGQLTALFIEDLGSDTLETAENGAELAARLGEELAKLHRAYCYRTDELINAGVMRTLLPIDYEAFSATLVAHLSDWQLITAQQERQMQTLAQSLAQKLAGEPTSLVHGDMYAENIILRGEKMFFIDWSWFTIIGVPLMDCATLTMKHPKNGSFNRFREVIIDAYCFESGRDAEQTRALLPYAETLSRLMFLNWLVERRKRGILGTTVGPVDLIIPNIIGELTERLTALP